MKHQQHWQTLGLPPGTSIEKVQQAYRELMQIWHPDRFAQHSSLRIRAEEQSKKITNAYQELEGELSSAGKTAARSRRTRALAGRRRQRERTVSSARLTLLVFLSAAAVAATAGIPSFESVGGSGGIKTFGPLRPTASETIVSGTSVVIGTRSNIPAPVRAAIKCDLAALTRALDGSDSPDAADRAGVSALAWTARTNCLAGAEILIRRGANLNARSENGFTPVVWAKTHNHEKMVATLLNAGAKPPPEYWQRS